MGAKGDVYAEIAKNIIFYREPSKPNQISVVLCRYKKTINHRFDVVIVGSDQVWRKAYNVSFPLDSWFLGFASDNVKKSHMLHLSVLIIRIILRRKLPSAEKHLQE